MASSFKPKGPGTTVAPYACGTQLGRLDVYVQAGSQNTAVLFDESCVQSSSPTRLLSLHSFLAVAWGCVTSSVSDSRRTSRGLNLCVFVSPHPGKSDPRRNMPGTQRTFGVSMGTPPVVPQLDGAADLVNVSSAQRMVQLLTGSLRRAQDRAVCRARSRSSCTAQALSTLFSRRYMNEKSVTIDAIDFETGRMAPG